MKDEEMEVYEKNVIFDFDGVIHSFTTPWEDATIIPDEPVEGIKELIEEIRKEYRVVIVSSRAYYDNGVRAIEDWLDKYEIEVDRVTAIKVPAIISIDDRVLLFDGKTEGILEKIKNFKPWNKMEE